MENLAESIFKDQSLDVFAQDIVKGFSSIPKRIPSKYLYDAKGDDLFRQIMELPEYYLTRCETSILEIYKEEILRICCDNEPFKLVDLGAGDGTKTEILIRYFLKSKISFEYIAIDISQHALETLLTRIRTKYPEINARGINAEYSEALQQLIHSPEKKLLLFLGSTLGNFDNRDAVSFLHKVRENLNFGDLLLLGLDLKKDPDIIKNAYSDARGVTAEFNFNLLRRINTELGGNINIRDFIHNASYNPVTGEVYSFLISKKKQKIEFKNIDKAFTLEKWETIQTECSNKYDIESITRLADESGWSIKKSFFDSKAYFTDSLWRKE
jgi:L-histidine Nalpha-methyltransferase